MFCVNFLAVYRTGGSIMLVIWCICCIVIVGFSVGQFEWYRFETLPLFFTQLISAYEGIGCVSCMRVLYVQLIDLCNFFVVSVYM